MFRVSNPWDGWMRPSDDDAYPFAMPASHLRASAPFEGFGFDQPDEYRYPGYRTGRRHPTIPAALFPGYPRQPRQQTFFPTSPAPHDPYDSLAEPPFVFHYPRRAAAAPEPAFYMGPAPPQAPRGRAVPHPAAEDANASDVDYEQDDEHGLPFLLHNGCVLKPPVTQRVRQHKQPVMVGKPQPLASAPLTQSGAGGSKAAVFSESACHSDPDDADGSDPDGHHPTLARAGGRSVQPQPVLVWDPLTGRSFRAIVPAAVAAATGAHGVARAAKGDGGKDSVTAAREFSTKPQCDSTAPYNTPAPGPAAAAATSPSRANTAQAARGSSAAGSGPTRILVRSVDSNDAAATRGPGIASASAASAACASASASASGSLERQNSTALVTRPPLEVALSRGPSAVLPAAVATVADADAAAASGSRTASTIRASASHAAVSTAAAAGSTAAASARAGSSSIAESQAVHSKGPIAAATAPRMTRSMAARTIQRWWRGWRLWRHTPALRVLMALSAELRRAAACYYGYMGATEGNLTDKQHLEVNELAMRVILKLDSLEGLPHELRALRKHLTARALRLQDEVQSAYAKSTTRLTLQRQAAMDPPPTAAAVPESFTADAEGAEGAERAEGAGGTSPATEDLVTPELSPKCDATDLAGSPSTETAAAAAVMGSEDGVSGSSGRPSGASVVASGDLRGASAATAAATAKCARALRRRCKHVRAKHGGGFDHPSAPSLTSKSLSAPVLRRPQGDDVNISRISGRLLQRLRRRFGASAAAAAVAAAAAAAAHLPPAASSRRGASQSSGQDVCVLRKQRHVAHNKQQQQQQQSQQSQQSQQPQHQQQQPVFLRVVVQSDVGADVDGGSIRSCRSAMFVESGVQTD